jgi:hypothetical protein
MSFYITLTDGTALSTVLDGTVDNTSSSINLIGKNFPTYGQLINQNFVSILENFSNAIAPNMPLVGQIWYDNKNNQLKFYRSGTSSSYWQNIPNVIYSSDTPGTPQQYDLWYDTANQQIKIYDSLQWITIGPNTTGDGLFRVSGNNSFRVEIGGNTLLQVDRFGNTNTPLNPAFSGVGYTYNTVINGSGSLSPTTWIPRTITTNIGTLSDAVTASWNNSLGQFTCPVAGLYQVSGTVISLGSTTINATNQYLLWWHNSADTGIDSRAYHVNTSYIPLTATGLIQCSAGDTIQMVVWADSGGQIDYNNSSMMIRLVA